MGTLYFIRSAESIYAESGSPNEHLRPLTEKGKAQAVELGGFLKRVVAPGDTLLSHPDRRTKTTALLALGGSGLSNQLVTSQRLMSIDPETVIAEALDHLASNHSENSIIFTCEDVIRAALSGFVVDDQPYPIAPGSVTKFTYSDDQIELEYANLVAKYL